MDSRTPRDNRNGRDSKKGADTSAFDALFQDRASIARAAEERREAEMAAARAAQRAAERAAQQAAAEKRAIERAATLEVLKEQIQQYGFDFDELGFTDETNTPG